MVNQIKVALPKGRILKDTASLLEKAGWGLSDYSPGMRNYRLSSKKFPGMMAKTFHEKDVPIQVAIGNYDLGICGIDWVEELMVKYPSSAIVRVRDLGYGRGAIFAIASKFGKTSNVEDIKKYAGKIRLVSEYPNLAESFALEMRLKQFSIFPLWGAAEAYPPDSSELALVAGAEDQGLFDHELVPVSKILNISAFLIANKTSWEEKDLSEVLASLDVHNDNIQPESKISLKAPKIAARSSIHIQDDAVRLALPDGHQQKPTVELLTKAGIKINDYPSPSGYWRPASDLEGVTIKVIRPQDMPQQVANGNFDLAVTGKDWVKDHLYLFPSSPIVELLDLKFGWVKIVAVVTNEVPVENIFELRQLYASKGAALRVAAEYVNIADKYARDNRFGRYRVIPTWGATEAFLPEDADMLIENTQTGGTIARHNLKIIDTLFESTACLLGNKDSVNNPAKKARIDAIIKKLKRGLS